MTKYRSGRINEEMKRQLSDIIRNELNDPRITAMVSITKVDVTKDLKYAKVFVSLFGSEEQKENTMAALKSSLGYLRREVGHRIDLRITPELIIEIDNTIEHGMHIDALLAKIKENKHNDNE